MVVDIIIVNHKSDWLFRQQVEHWHNYMKGDFRLVLVDSTPGIVETFPQGYALLGETVHVIAPTSSFDGINSGQAYDYAISLCTSDIIGMTDPDHFWLDNLFLPLVIEPKFAEGYKCIGDAGFYRDFQSIFDVANPTHRGELAPVLWGQFIDRELALSETWVCDPPGVGQITGWRVREKIIDQDIKRITLPGFYQEIEGEDPDICYFGWDKHMPQAVHFLKGGGGRSHVMESRVPPVLAREKAKWV